MKKIVLSFVTLMIFGFLAIANQVGQIQIHPLDNMPIVNSPELEQLDRKYSRYALPNPIRNESVRNYLQASVRIINGNTSGSGTICYYDSSKNIAYIITCGHLWKGSYNSATSPNKRTCQIEVWYHNDTKLDSPKRYSAEIIAYISPDAGNDIGFIKFTPDWTINKYYPIAPIDFNYKEGEVFESCGCDHAQEVAAYEVSIVGIEGKNLVTTNNSPRPGRSGGGLLTKDGQYIGICWGTQRVDGSGLGFFVPLPRIHAFCRDHGLEWLLRVNNEIDIPIIDLRGPRREYPKNYIPRP